MSICQSYRRIIPAFLTIAFMLIFLAGCTGGADNGAKTVINEDTTPPVDDGGFIYTGAKPQTDDVQNFRLKLWSNIISGDRCGQCHSETGGQAPLFARKDDVNLAYAAANTVVNLVVPSQSSMVKKFQTGHFCYDAEQSVCADNLSLWISAWANTVEGKTNKVELIAPPLKDPGSSKTFPDTSAVFKTTVYPILEEYCQGCHAETASTPQSPFFASTNVDSAYLAAKSKISLDTPESSRLFVRVNNEFHNCWSNCKENGDELLAAILAFSDQVPTSAANPDHVKSNSMSLYDGIIASSGGRNDDNIIAMYQFKTGKGDRTFDTSGVDTPMHLNLSGEYEWVGGWGIRFVKGKAQATTQDSNKLYRLITSTGEYSLEAWVAPNNVTQEGPARIITYSAGNSTRNFTLGQTLYNYNFLHRSTTSSANGEPALSTPDDDEVLQATLQHVVVTFDSVNGRKLYVNGKLIEVADSVDAGNLTDWDSTFAFILGGEPSLENSWQGVIRLVAIYNRAIKPEQIVQNFSANVGERFFLLFGVADKVKVPNAFVVFEVSQFDSYSYLFSKPFFISLDKEASYSNIPLEGIHIGINGKIATGGQAFVNLKTTLESTQKNEEGRQYLSTIGTVIALDKNTAQDEFYLVFDKLGDKTHVIVAAEPVPINEPVSNKEQSDIGLKTFDEINASMAKVTGVAKTNPVIVETYTRIKQQLPTVEKVETFLSSHQVAITQLAIEYCNVLVEEESKKANSSYFPGLVFSKPANTAFVNPDLLTDPLIKRMIGEGLPKDPSSSEIKTELNKLIITLTSCGNACNADKTKTVSKAVCAAVLGSASTELQ